MNELDSKIQGLKEEIEKAKTEEVSEEQLRDLQTKVDDCNLLTDQYAMDNPDDSQSAEDIIDLMMDMSYLRVKNRRPQPKRKSGIMVRVGDGDPPKDLSDCARDEIAAYLDLDLYVGEEQNEATVDLVCDLLSMLA